MSLSDVGYPRPFLAENGRPLAHDYLAGPTLDLKVLAAALPRPTGNEKLALGLGVLSRDQKMGHMPSPQKAPPS